MRLRILKCRKSSGRTVSEIRKFYGYPRTTVCDIARRHANSNYAKSPINRQKISGLEGRLEELIKSYNSDNLEISIQELSVGDKRIYCPLNR